MSSSELLINDRKTGAVMVIAWVLTFLVSFFPDALFYELTGDVPGWLVWAKVGLLGIFLAACLLWKEIRALWQYALVIAVLHLSFEIREWIAGAGWFQNLLGGSPRTFTARLMPTEMLDLVAAAIMIAVLWALKRQWSQFFFAKGDATVETTPVRWLGVTPGTPVYKFGMVFLAVASIALLVTLGLGAKPSLTMLADALPLLPVVLFGAALNAFSEEVSFRTSLLSTSHELLGPGQAVWMAALFFGSAHYIGGQPGLLPGVLITAFLGWGFGKCMLESKSIRLPWFMHFGMNAIIFFFNAMGSTL